MGFLDRLLGRGKKMASDVGREAGDLYDKGRDKVEDTLDRDGGDDKPAPPAAPAGGTAPGAGSAGSTGMGGGAGSTSGGAAGGEHSSGGGGGGAT